MRVFVLSVRSFFLLSENVLLAFYLLEVIELEYLGLMLALVYDASSFGGLFFDGIVVVINDGAVVTFVDFADERLVFGR